MRKVRSGWESSLSRSAPWRGGGVPQALLPRLVRAGLGHDVPCRIQLGPLATWRGAPSACPRPPPACAPPPPGQPSGVRSPAHPGLLFTKTLLAPSRCPSLRRADRPCLFIHGNLVPTSTLCHFPRVCGRVQNKFLDVGWHSRGRGGRTALRTDAMVHAPEPRGHKGFVPRSRGPPLPRSPPGGARTLLAAAARLGGSGGRGEARSLDPQSRRDTPRSQTGKLRHGGKGLSVCAVYLAVSTLVTRSPCNATHGPRRLSFGALRGLHLDLDLLRPVPGLRQVDGTCCRVNE